MTRFNFLLWLSHYHYDSAICYYLMMQRHSFSEMNCPIALSAEEIVDGWTIFILREAVKGALTFNTLIEKLPIAPTTLTRRLKSLVDKGFFVKTQYQANPVRHHYELTDKSRDLLPILIALGEWGHR